MLGRHSAGMKRIRQLPTQILKFSDQVGGLSALRIGQISGAIEVAAQFVFDTHEGMLACIVPTGRC
ncbi:hypothetical protein D477_003143 [Arthrobacter crystallopoietes BAB-32]|uniref:Uncharacterized protein n=1 Tax=Arthrobacter crystallopoietes BAB-32 TaxID=1246476 RepID=N1V6C5_9MICC|nr:hypothetical protein D477_003143 [Arthrobacter crystallopoietes BAB-32]